MLRQARPELRPAAELVAPHGPSYRRALSQDRDCRTAKPGHAERSGIVRRTIPRSRSIPTGVPEAGDFDRPSASRMISCSRRLVSGHAFMRAAK